MRLLLSIALFGLVSTADARTPDTVPRSAIERGVAEGYKLLYEDFYADRIAGYKGGKGAEIAARQVCRYNGVDCGNLPAGTLLYLPPPETLKCLARSTGDDPCAPGSFRATADPAVDQFSVTFDSREGPVYQLHNVETIGHNAPEESERERQWLGHTTNPWVREGTWPAFKSEVVAHYRSRYPDIKKALAERDAAALWVASVCLYNTKRGNTQSVTCDELAPGEILYLPPAAAVYCDVSNDLDCNDEHREVPEHMNYLEVMQDGDMVIRLQSGR